MSIIDSLNSDDLAVLASTIAISLAKDKTNDEINVLGNLVAAVGALLLTIAAQNQSIDSIQEKKQQIKDLKNELKR